MHLPLQIKKSSKNSKRNSPRLASSAETDEETTTEEITEQRIQEPWKVILYNDDIHTFDEVILQLRKATGCTEEDAAKIALEAHFRGKAIAYSGPFEKCFKVMSILREIQLIVEIEG